MPCCCGKCRCLRAHDYSNPTFKWSAWVKMPSTKTGFHFGRSGGLARNVGLETSSYFIWSQSISPAGNPPYYLLGVLRLGKNGARRPRFLVLIHDSIAPTITDADDLGAMPAGKEGALYECTRDGWVLLDHAEYTGAYAAGATNYVYGVTLAGSNIDAVMQDDTTNYGSGGPTVRTLLPLGVLCQSPLPMFSPDDTPSLRRTLNHVYRTLYYAHDWQHLKTMFAKLTLNAGQRHYDVPTGLDFDRIIEANVWWAGQPHGVERGVGFAEYAQYDPDADERSSPMEKWDVRFTGTEEQIEVWPLPDGGVQSLQFFGLYKHEALVNNTDVCRLESELVVLYAAAELLPKDSPDKDAKMAAGKELLGLLKKRGTSGAGKTYTNGAGGGSANAPHPRTTVRVGG